MNQRKESGASVGDVEQVSLRVHPALASRLRKERVRRFSDKQRGNVSLNSLVIEFAELALNLLDAADMGQAGSRGKNSVGAIARSYVKKQREVAA